MISLFKNSFIKFIFVGILNTLFGYAVYSIFIFFNVHYSLASLMSTILGVAFNYKSIGVLVFSNKNNGILLKLKFISIYLVTYLINLLSLSILSKYFNLYASAAILVIPLALLSFFLNKTFVFNKNVDGAFKS